MTLPLAYVAPLLLAILAGQVVHEAGHAIAAGLHRVKPLAMGVLVVFPCVPIAYVALPAAQGRLTRREQLRIVSAGVWHNAGVLLVLSLLSAGAARVFWADAPGLAIRRSTDPALAPWVPAGATISALNDRAVARASRAERLEAWEAFVRHDLPDAHGWCVGVREWQNATDACCRTPTPAHACFRAGDARCLDPVRVFRTSARCDAACDGVCVRPAPHEVLGRLTVEHARGTELVVLRGPFDTLRRSVVVSVDRLAAWIEALRLTRIAEWAARACEVLLSVLLLSNTTLCLFNMLPVAPLDGGAYVRLLVAEAFARHYGDVSDAYVPMDDAPEHDVEDAECAPWAPRAERVVRGVQALALLLALAAVARSTWTAVRHVL